MASAKKELNVSVWGLEKNNALTYLKLQRNEIDDKGAMYLPQGLEKNCALKLQTLKKNIIYKLWGKKYY